MKRFVVIAFLISGLMMISASARENSGKITNDGVRSSREQSSTQTPTAQAQVRSGSPVQAGEPQQSDDNDAGRLVVNVWRAAPQDDVHTDALSPDFTRAALSTAFRMRSTQRTLEDCIKKRYPLNELWIHSELDSIDESLKLASLSATNDADREALQQLENEHNRLQLWTDWLIDAKKNLRLADYYMSDKKLDNDEQFQSSLACTSFLVSMLSSRRLAEGYACH